ncbi:protein-glutamine gamma-glutamyltransferase E-like [Leucoraja erinacea]|uniref:protein-glutamine gamma-glutamyltransferase E-like n=1 Tax=Leucoraja erinaceus TaxID=7782 RepID=UPI002456CAFA|nr:protein-glutamine gamma-glutamyltransferase E-like [Leucoraja erinacea]
MGSRDSESLTAAPASVQESWAGSSEALCRCCESLRSEFTLVIGMDQLLIDGKLASIGGKCQVDLQCAANNKAHRTIEISEKRLFLRRGQSFDINVIFKDGFNPQNERLELAVTNGTELRTLKGLKYINMMHLHACPKYSKIVFPFRDELNERRWSGVIKSFTKNELSLTITSSPRAIIGRYSFSLQREYMDISYFLGNFVLLFNPWCAGDEVYLNSDVQRNEYVLNETGTIYYGGSDYICEREWNFGQFEEDILDICLNLLDNALLFTFLELCLPCPTTAAAPSSRGLTTAVSLPLGTLARASRVEAQVGQSGRGHPRLGTMEAVKWARSLRCSPARLLGTTEVNSANDQGVLQGRWSSPYTGGVYPGKWNGSIAILRQWQKSNFKPVRYGQCWVFAAVTCTVLRSLGIPTRVVTNFDSAHDTDANLTIDNYYNVEGDDIGGSSDSVWNFHVWNESWMARDDLVPGYDGWQVVDATPQEESDGNDLIRIQAYCMHYERYNDRGRGAQGQ